MDSYTLRISEQELRALSALLDEFGGALPHEHQHGIVSLQSRVNDLARTQNLFGKTKESRSSKR